MSLLVEGTIAPNSATTSSELKTNTKTTTGATSAAQDPEASLYIARRRTPATALFRATETALKPGTRKRRQPVSNDNQQILPEKSRRYEPNAENNSPSGPESNNPSSSPILVSRKSLGGFFSSLALKIRSSSNNNNNNHHQTGKTSSPAVENNKRIFSRPNSPAGQQRPNYKIEQNASARQRLRELNRSIDAGGGGGPAASHQHQKHNSPENSALKRQCSNVSSSTIRDSGDIAGSTEDLLQLSSRSKASSVESIAMMNEQQEQQNGKSKFKFLLRKDPADRLRKTVQWLEEGSRQLREELATARNQLHEERRAAKIMKCNLEAILRDAKSTEAAKYERIIAELKTRLLQTPSKLDTSVAPCTKTDFLKDENHRREISALKNRLKEAELTIKNLKTISLSQSRTRLDKSREIENVRAAHVDVRRLEGEILFLRNMNKKLEEKLQLTEESLRARTTELKAQHDKHEAELTALQRALRSDTIRMIDEIQRKCREIKKLEKHIGECTRTNEKLRSKVDEVMRKLRENEKGLQLRLASRIEEKISHDDDSMIELSKVECEAVAEVSRLRELALEQQEVIEVLRQAVKEKERKLERLSNKRRKDEIYKQWWELEPVVEVDDEEDHEEDPVVPEGDEDQERDRLQEEGDSALSSAPCSLSPQPGGGQDNWAGTTVTREAYEAVLLEIEELQGKLIEQQKEIEIARCQVRDLERALLEESQGNQACRRAFNDKLREAEEREANLTAEVSELREQNELLEFRVLELEESPNSRDTPDLADSGIVSPEPIHLYKDQSSQKQRDRAVATVIPYPQTFNSSSTPSTGEPGKPPLSLQESGIFEDEDAYSSSSRSSELSSRATQTEAPGGELLQEVQRLQELRARIQERAFKVLPPGSPNSTCTRSRSPSDSGEHFLRERIRELEENLAHQEAERKLSKQREEELVHENCRLAENAHWLEAELKKQKKQPPPPGVDIDTMTETVRKSDAECMTEITVDENISATTKVHRTERKLEISCPLRINTWPRSEINAQQLEAIGNLRHVEMNRAKRETETEARRRAFLKQLAGSYDEEPSPIPMEVDQYENAVQNNKLPHYSQALSDLIMRTDIQSSAKIAKGKDEVDVKETSRGSPAGLVTELAKEAREEDNAAGASVQQCSIETTDASNSGKKQVIYFRWR